MKLPKSLKIEEFASGFLPPGEFVVTWRIAEHDAYELRIFDVVPKVIWKAPFTPRELDRLGWKRCVSNAMAEYLRFLDNDAQWTVEREVMR